MHKFIFGGNWKPALGLVVSHQLYWKVLNMQNDETLFTEQIVSFLGFVGLCVLCQLEARNTGA